MLTAMVMLTTTVPLTTTASDPSLATGVAYAAPAMLAAAFRDLPASVRAGDPLAVQVTVPSNSTCDGVVTFRDSESLKLDLRDETGAGAAGTPPCHRVLGVARPTST